MNFDEVAGEIVYGWRRIGLLVVRVYCVYTHLSAILARRRSSASLEAIVAKNGRNHSKSLPIPGQLSRGLKRFPKRQQPLMVLNSGASRQCSKFARPSLTSTGYMSVESESFFMLGSRDLGETY